LGIDTLNLIYALKRNEVKQKQNICFDVQKCFFHLFYIDVKHRNLKQNYNEMKQKQNKKEAKKEK
jgi:hypothetical protein